MPNKKYIFYILLSLSVLFSCEQQDVSKPNTHIIRKVFTTSWQFRQLPDGKWYPAVVPGAVHTDLLRNGLIPDPFFGLNEHKLQWIENEDWEYSAGFDLDDEIWNREHIELVFKGLDTYADVFLNDSLILKADNMFRTWRVDVKTILKKYDNALRVVFHSPLEINKPKLDALPYHLPAGNDRSQYKVSVFTRKAPYHFGWDWGPRFVTAGIWRPIEFCAWNRAKIDDFQVYQQRLSKEEAVLTAQTEIQSSRQATLSAQLVNDGTVLARKNFVAKEGLNNIHLEFRIKKPRLWWTHNLGEPYLYDFALRISDGDTVLDRRSLRFGLRRLEVMQEADSVGSSFYFKLNGIPVFMKGANYISQDNFLPRVSAERYAKLIEDAKKVHMNMLRVWGGGIYEDDLFYDLCDENGILVWQDFMFACSMYPGDSVFVESVRREAVDNVKRLRNHPSIALWCGNNEIQVAWERWGFQKTFGYSPEDSAKIYNDYLKVFHDVLPSVVKKYDPGRFYWPSSPNSAPSGWEEEAASGDLHYWSVWWGKEPFSAYEKYVGRFVSEYGFQSLPVWPTIKRFTPDTSRYLVSPALKSHNKHPVGFETIDEYMRRNFKIPDNLKDYIVVSQVLQAEGMKTAIEAHRRARPYCMGTLYWQLNDCWPTASWSSIDYFGRWKAFHYYLRRLYAPVLLSPLYANGLLQVYAVSDLLKDRNALLTLTLMDFYGKTLWQKKLPVRLAANGSAIVFAQPFEAILQGYERNIVFLYAVIEAGDSLLAENNLFFAKIKDLDLPPAKITVNKAAQNGRLVLTIFADVFVKNLFLDYEDDRGVFSNNYFDLLPGQPKKILTNLPAAQKSLAEKIRLRGDLFR